MVQGVNKVSLEQAKIRKKGKKKKRFIFRSIVLLILLAAVVYALVSNFNKDKSIYGVGDEAPDFQLKQVNEHNELETIQLSELEGKGVMLNFWATYCKPCEAEMPFMEELYPKYKDKGVEIVAVSLDVAPLVINQFINRYNLTFPVPHDSNGEVMDLYKIGPIPSTFFIGPDGKIVDKVEGALTLEKLEGHLQEIQPEL